MADQGLRASPSSEGAAVPWILEHLLVYPNSHELPLRSMYSLNSSHTAKKQSYPPNTPLHSAKSSRESNSMMAPSPTTLNDVVEENSSAQDSMPTASRLKANLMSQIAQLPAQQCSLPPSFVTSFVRRCFPLQLETVDFPQALTALDYLRDLELRRRKDVLAAFTRLGVERGDLEDRAGLAMKCPGVSQWVNQMEAKEKKVEALYTQVYIGLRRWILINEMLLDPFNKASCLAMLNTIFPPVTAVQPTSQLTQALLLQQRNGFFRYIQAVEENGKQVLSTLISQGKREGESNAWPVVWEAIDRYLRAANVILEECSEITGRESLEDGRQAHVPKSRKVDSGISFTSNGRPSTSSSDKSNNKPLPPAPSSPTEPQPTKSTGSTLERIAKEIRRMRSRADVADGSKEKTRTLKKMKSVGALSERDRNIQSASSDLTGFDADEFQRKRLLWEAKQKKRPEHAKHASS